MIKFAEYPYQEYKLYLVFHKKEERWFANLVNPENKERTTLSYSRYLMSVHLKRFLTDDEIVHHKDTNKLNDTIENLEILTDSKHHKLHKEINNTPLVKLQCPVCKKIFFRPKNRAYQKIHLGKDVCCSRSCGSKKSHWNKIQSNSILLDININ